MQLGDGASNSNTYGPVSQSGSTKYSYHEILYLSSELCQYGGTIKAIAFQAAGSYSLNVAIYMKNVTKSSFDGTYTDWVTATDLTPVYNGTYSFVSGWNVITLTTPFEYEAGKNLLVAIDNNTSLLSAVRFYYNSPGLGYVNQGKRNSSNISPTSPGMASDRYTSRPNTAFCIKCRGNCTDRTGEITFTNTTVNLAPGYTSANDNISSNTVSPTGTVSFTSSNPLIASVDENTGIVTAVADGDATITATIEDDGTNCEYVNTYTVHVSCLDPSMEWSRSSFTANQTTTSFPTLYTGNAGSPITYSSSSPSVATINSSGVITIVGSGTTTISASAPANGDYCATTASYTLTIDGTCPPTFEDVHENYYIRNFTATGGTVGIDNTSLGTANTYSDYYDSRSFTTLENVATTMNFSITAAGGATYGAAIWVDYNNDGIFAAGERVWNTTSAQASPITGNFTVPASATRKTYRMRVVIDGNDPNPSDPCHIGQGEVEDYKIITPKYDCNNPGSRFYSSQHIDNVNTTGHAHDINNPQTFEYPGQSYSNFYNSQYVQVSVGSQLVVNVTLELGDDDRGYVVVWVDWNNDGTFNNDDERVYVSGTIAATQHATFTIPSWVQPGSYRMRILGNRYLTYASYPCGDADLVYGEYEDYKIVVTVPTLTYANGNCAGTFTNVSPSTQQGYDYITLNSQEPSCSGGGTFAGWNTMADGSGQYYQPGGTYYLSGDATLYAMFLPDCCVPDNAFITYTHGGKTDTARMADDNYFYYNICRGETMIATLNDERGCGYSDFHWTLDSLATHLQTGNAANFSHTFNYEWGYKLNLTAHSTAGCDLRTKGRVRVSGGIGWLSNKPDHIYTCPGNEQSVTIGYEGSDSYVEVNHPGVQLETSLGHSNTIFLPDGIACDADGDPSTPASCAYVSTVTFTQFSDDAVIRDYNDILYLHMNLEHAWLPDLYISIECPNHNRAAILNLYNPTVGGASGCVSSIPTENQYWTGETGFGGGGIEIQFGVPDMSTDNSAANCNPSDNPPGTGWNYAWSNNDNHGYTYAGGMQGFVYNTGNYHNTSGNRYPIDSTNMAEMTQVYHPEESFANLVGCPLNGDWTITVMDGWSKHNGYLFEWDLALSEDLLGESWSYSVALDTAWSNCTWSRVGSKFSGITITAPDNLEPGHDYNASCNLTFVDEYGCQTNKDIDIVFEVGSIGASKSSTEAHCGSSDGTITITSPTGTAPFEYSIDAGAHYQSSNTFTGLAGGTYTVRVRDANGCYVDEEVTVDNIGAPTFTYTSTNKKCKGGADDGTITISTVTVGSTEYTSGSGFEFQVDGGAWVAGSLPFTLSGLDAGDHTVSVRSTSDPTCSATPVTVIIGEPATAVSASGITLDVAPPIVCENEALIINASTTTAIGGTPGYTYTWEATHGNINNLGASGSYAATAQASPYGGMPSYVQYDITYSLIVTDANGCKDTQTTVVTVNPVPQVSTRGASGCLHNPIELSLIRVTGGTLPYGDTLWTASWFDPNAGTVQELQPSGNALVTPTSTDNHTYQVSVIDANGCIGSNTATAFVYPLPQFGPVTINAPSCYGESDASVSFTPSGGTGVYTIVTLDGTSTTPVGGVYTWTGVAAGEHTLRIRDSRTADGCDSVKIINIDQPTPVVVSATGDTPICEGDNVTLTAGDATGGAGGPYTYTWTALTAGNDDPTPNEQSATATPSTTGTVSYVVTARDASGCPGRDTVDIVVNPKPTFNLSMSAVTCYGGSNGHIYINSVAGTPDFVFATSESGPWQSLTPNGSGTYTWPDGVSAGTHTIYVKDGNGCIGSLSIYVDQPANPISLTATYNQPTCNGFNDGSIEFTVQGGTNPYTVTVDGHAVAPTSGSTYDATGLGVGNHSVHIVDANNCEKEAILILTEPNPIVVEASISSPICQGGEVDMEVTGVTGGSGDYTSYTWTAVTAGNDNPTPGGTPTGYTATATPSTTGSVTYRITVTDNNTCTGYTDVTATVNTLPTVTVNSPAICQGQTATLTAGGAASYTWTPTDDLTISGNTATTTVVGTYTVEGTDANGCKNTATATVTVNALPTVTVNSPAICQGETAELTAGGAVDYTWSPSTGLTITDATHGSTATTTTAGTWTVTGTDANGCTNTATATVTVNTLPTITVNSPTVCSGESATLTAGGAASYTWTPADDLTISGNTATTTVAGTYTVEGTDANGCKNTATATVTVNALPTVTVNSPAVCQGETATLTAGGAASYTWTPADDLTISGNTAATTVAGTYTVTGTDANGCSNTATATVTVNTLPTVTVNSPAICQGETATLTAGGAASYTWTPDDDLTISGNTATTTVAGTYTVTGTDANGCTNTATATVTVNTLPTVTVNSPAVCQGETATLTAGGAASYTWTPADDLTISGNTATTTVAGTYTVTGTDANGCSNTATATVTVNTLPTVTVNSPAICQGQTATLTAGGAASYTWIPADDLTISGNTATTTVAGTYTVTGTDANGCSNTATATVTVNALPTVTVNSPAICQGQTATLTASGAASYTWTPADDLTISGNTATTTVAGTYTVTGTDANGCSNTATATVTVNALPTVTVNSPAICQGQTATLTASGAVDYTWSPNTGLTITDATHGSTATTTTAGTWTVTGTDANGCSNTATATVTVNTLPTVTVNSPAICQGETATLTASGAASYTWTPADDLTISGNTATTTVAGTYTVTGTDANGCSNTATATVTVNAMPTVTVNSPAICQGQTATLTASGAVDYTWSPSTGLTITDAAHSSTATTTTAGTWTVTGTDANGCSNTATATVTLNTLPTITATSDPVCEGEDVEITASGAATYTWSPMTDVTLSGTGNNIATIDNAVNGATYTITGTDANGCINTTTHTIVVRDSAELNVTNATQTVCQGGSITPIVITYENATVNITPSLPDGLTVTHVNATKDSIYGEITGATSGQIYTFTVNADNANDCGDKQQVCTITISARTEVNPTVSGCGSYHWTSANEDRIFTASIDTVIGPYTDSRGCDSITNLHVVVNPLPNPTMNDVTVCLGGSATLTVNETYAHYVWSNGVDRRDSTVVTSAVGETTYTVHVTDANGCEADVSAKIIVNEATKPVITGRSTICNGDTDTLTTTTDYSSYTWTGGDHNDSLFVTATGDYTVTTMDANGCTATSDPFHVEVLDPITITENSKDSTYCYNEAADSLSFTAHGGNGSYTYQWEMSTNGVDFTPITGAQDTAYTPATNVAAGSYTYRVTVDDGMGCGPVQQIIAVITVREPLTLTETSPDAGYCKDSASATIGVVAHGGSGEYEYQWVVSTDGGAFTNIAGATNANYTPTTTTVGEHVYQVTVSDKKGCGDSTRTIATITIYDNVGLDMTNATQVVCAGGTITPIVITATNANTPTVTGLPGTLNYDPVAGTITGTVSGNAGDEINFTVSATGLHGCGDSTLYGKITISARTEKDSSVTACGSLHWTTANEDRTFTASIDTLIGPYTSASGCDSVTNLHVVINPVPTPVITGTDHICLEDTIFLTATEEYDSYSWSNGATTRNDTIVPTVANTYDYTVTVTKDGCSGTSAVHSVTVYTLPVPVINGDHILCYGGSTTLTTTVSYDNYVWSSGAPDVNATGDYTVIATDSHGCKDTSAVFHVEVLDELTITENSADATYCRNEAADSLSFTAHGGNGTYTYQWEMSTNGVDFNPISGANDTAYTPATNLAEGTYTYRVTVDDGLNCGPVQQVIAIITIRPAFVVSNSNSATGYCEGATATAIGVTPTGGAGGYTYQWAVSTDSSNYINVSTDSAYTPNTTTAGTYYYRITVTDSECGDTTLHVQTVNVWQHVGLDLVGDLNQAKCIGSDIDSVHVVATSAASVDVTINPSTIPFTYNETTGNIGFTTAGNENDVITVTVVAHGEHGCGDSTLTFKVTLSALTVVNRNVTECGSYTWTSAAHPSEDEIFSTPGTYDRSFGPYAAVNGCDSTTTLHVVINPNPVPVITGTTPVCLGDTAVLTTTEAYASYDWDNGVSTANDTIVPTVANTYNYTVTVTNAEGCSGTSAAFTLTVNDTAILSATNTSQLSVCQGGNITPIKITYGHGTIGFEYNSAAGLPAGLTYNASDSTITGTPTGVAGDEFTFSIINTNANCGNKTETCTIKISAVTAVNVNISECGSYSWTSTAHPTENTTFDTPGTYDMTFGPYTAVNGCDSTVNLHVVINANPVPVITGTTPVCLGDTAVLTTTVAYDAYDWDNGVSTANDTIVPTVANTYNYTVTVTDGNGCSGTSGVFTLTVNDTAILSATNTSQLSVCQGGNITPIKITYANGTIGFEYNSAAGLPAGLTYNASDSTITGSPTGVAGDEFTFTIIDTNTNCGNKTVTCTIKLGAQTIVDSTITGCGSVAWASAAHPAEDSTFTVSTTVNYGPYTAVNGCDSTTRVQVVINPNPVPVITGTTPVCLGDTAVLTTTEAYASYSWDNGVSTANNTIVPTTSGTTNYTVTVTDGNGCSGTSAAFALAVNDTAILSATNTSQLSVCQGGNITPIKITYANGTIGFEYNSAAGLPAGLTYNASDSTITGSPTGVAGDEFTFTIIDTNTNCGDKTVTCTIKLGAQTIVDSTITGCGSVAWASAAHPAEDSTFTVSTVIDYGPYTAVNGCDSTLRLHVDVNGGTTPVFSVPDEVCVSSSLANDSIEISVQALTGYTYTWTIDGGTYAASSPHGADGVSDTNRIVVRWATDGDKSVSVTLTNIANTCEGSASKTIHVHPVPGIAIDAVAGDICPQSGNLTLEARLDPATTADYTYTWGGEVTVTTAEPVSSYDTNTATAVIPTTSCDTTYKVGVGVSDNYGCAAVADSVTIVVRDVEPPTFTRPANDTIYKNDICEYDASVSVTGDASNLNDNCTAIADLVVSHTDNIEDGSCYGETIIRRAWRVTDLCGNVSDAADSIQTIVVRDTTSPVIVGPIDDIEVEGCDATAVPEAYSSIEELRSHTAGVSDNCSDDAHLTLSVSTAAPTGSCDKTVIRTYTVTDDCGNSTSIDQTITITYPTMVVPVSDTLPGVCESDAVVPPDDAITICGTLVSRVPYPDAATYRTVEAGAAGSTYITYTYTYTDCKGDHLWHRTYHITPEGFTPLDNVLDTVACPSDIVRPIPVPTLSVCGTPIAFDSISVTHSDAACGDSIFNYSYEVNGESYTWQYIVTFEPSEFSMPADSVRHVNCPSAIADPVAAGLMPTVTDACGNVLTAVAVSADPTPACDGTVVYTYNYNDCAGHSHEWHFTYIVETPDFTIAQADGSSIVACAAEAIGAGETGCPFTLPTVTSACLDVLTPIDTILGTMPTCSGNMTYTYLYRDCAGHEHSWTYTYIVRDTVTPTLTAPVAQQEAVPAGNCQYAIPDLSTIVPPYFSDNCGEVTFVSQSPVAGYPVNQLATEQIVNVEVTVTDPCNNNSVTTVAVRVPASDVSVNASRDVAICFGDATSLSATVISSNSGATQMTWSPANGLSSTSGSPVTASPTATTSYVVTAIDGNGCESTDTVVVTVHPLVTLGASPLQQEVCAGGQITPITVVAANASVSVVGLPTGVFYNSTTGIISGLPRGSAPFTITATSLYGCDPVSLDGGIVVTDTIRDYHSDVACDTYTWTLNGGTYSTTGTYTYGSTTAQGCEKIDYLNLTVNHQTYGIDNVTECDSYTWDRGNGQTYTSSTNAPTYVFRNGNAQGCDSTVTLHLTIHYSNSGDTSVLACDTYTWYGTTYTTDAVVQQQLSNMWGCDSTATLHLTVKPSYSFSLTDSLCDGDTYHFHGGNYTVGGTYTHTYQSVYGCDSVYNLDLTLLPTLTVEVSAEANCQTGQYEIHAQSDAGCYQWSAKPDHGQLASQSHESTIYVAPPEATTYTVVVGYGEGLMCPASASLAVDELVLPEAEIKVRPPYVTIDMLDWYADDASTGETSGREWYVDGMYYDQQSAHIQGIYDVHSFYDSVSLMLIAKSAQCADTAFASIPYLKAEIWVPNVFTPSLDNNNLFGADGIGIIEYEIWIYTREGLLVFHGESLDERWDGLHEATGTPCKQESYAYRIDYRFVTKPEELKTKVGMVLLLR